MQIIIEFDHYLETLMGEDFSGLPEELRNDEDFKAWITEEGRASEFANLFMMTLPSPRYSYYESSNYDVIQADVLSYSNDVVDALGFYPVDVYLDLLSEMSMYQYAVMFIGLIFDILIILFVIISILLIYSLLLISVETRTFEIGV